MILAGGAGSPHIPPSQPAARALWAHWQAEEYFSSREARGKMIKFPYGGNGLSPVFPLFTS